METEIKNAIDGLFKSGMIGEMLNLVQQSDEFTTIKKSELKLMMVLLTSQYSIATRLAIMNEENMREYLKLRSEYEKNPSDFKKETDLMVSNLNAKLLKQE